MEIIPIILILSIFMTFLMLYIISPNPKIILKYPNINDPISDLYVDDNNVCYRYHTKEIKCTKI